MSRQHPIIAVTGSSGAGTTTVKAAFEHIFRRLNVTPLIVEGDGFHRWDRQEMAQRIDEAERQGRHLSHFGLEANLLEELERLFESYGQSGQGKRRYYLHDAEEAAAYGQSPGTFTPWEVAGEGTDLLFYEGLHGAVVADGFDIARHPDLLIGVTPIVNLEWIQKIHRDTKERGYEARHVTEVILRRMYDYVHVITPQFSRTDINFQRVPMVDTSNPFVALDIPTADESMVVIRFQQPTKFNTDFPYLLAMFHDSFMSRRNNIVIPGGKMGLAFEIIFAPIIERMMAERHDRGRKLG
jgi:phosphoribulokinase